MADGYATVPGSHDDTDSNLNIEQKYTGESEHIFASGKELTEVTPSDSTVLDYKALYIGGDGSVVVSVDSGVTSVTFAGLLAGTILPVRGDRVMSVGSGTTATSIVAMNW